MNRHWVLAATLLLASGNTAAQNAADQMFDPEEMAKAREALWSSHGSQVNGLVLGERFEYRAADDPLLVWEGQGWIGTDDDKLWIKTEGEYETDDSRFEEFEVQALYSRAISPFWDLQIGIRHDFDPNPSRTYLTLGAQGLARYWFELDAQVFVSDRGKLSTRLEAEYELRFTQRLILQPRVEINAALSDDNDIGVSSGLSSVDAGLRLRYEFKRTLAPYVGIEWNRRYGAAAEAIEADNGDPSELSFVAGLRFWY
ncbi:MAG: copper resistance protein B [Pseudomonadota bacterium]